MKKLWKFMCIMTGLAVVIGACGTAAAQPPAATEPPVSAEGEAEPVGLSHPVVVAVPVAKIPVADGDTNEEQWKDAPVAQIGGMQWQAVYTDEDLALRLKWIDDDFSMSANSNYVWDPNTGSWSQISGLASWESYVQEWMNLAFNINSTVALEGCAAFCHEDPPGSGIFHHQTGTLGETVDSWMLLGRHGWSYGAAPDKELTSDADYGLPAGGEDKGWMSGNIVAKQNGPVVFDTTYELDPRVVVAGNVTFVDYAEDNFMVAHGDSRDANRDRPRDYYCKNCHVQAGLPYDPLEYDLTRPDDGQIKYNANWKVPYTAPYYMETDPKDFVDAMVLTQTEIDNGEAVAIEGLTPEQISEYWAEYDEVNGVVPPITLKQPGGSMADVLVGANWTNGVWDMEITRKLITPDTESDVQFDDLSKDYAFSLTISNSALLLGPYLSESGGILRFQQEVLAQQ